MLRANTHHGQTILRARNKSGRGSMIHGPAWAERGLDSLSLAVRLALARRHPLCANASTIALPSSSAMGADAPDAVHIENSTSGSAAKLASGALTCSPCPT